MNSLHWLKRDECLALHEMMISHYGGMAGIRDQQILEATLAHPQQLFHYGIPTISELAAAYASGIVKNRPFLDGNQRTGFMMGAAFLERNGYEFFATEADAVLRTRALAAGEMTEDAFANWLDTNSRPAKPAT